MKINPAGSPPKSGAGSRDEQGGLTTRMESAAKLKVPPPKGKGVVMLILAAAVVAAMIWDFTGRGAASRAVKRSVSQNDRPVAPKDPNAPVDPTPDPTPTANGTTISVQTGGVTLEVTPEAALALFNSAPDEKRQALRLSILEGLVKPAGRRDALGRQCFETAAWLIDGAGDDARGALAQLTYRAHAALTSDANATAAILFIARLPDSGGPITAAALDEVIGDPKRPLAVRVAAARARPKEGRPSVIVDLARDPKTHPALREALE